MGLFSWLGGGKKKSDDSLSTNDRAADKSGAEAGAPGPLLGNDEKDDAAAGDDGDGHDGGDDRVEELKARLESSNGAARVDGARALIERWRHGDAAAAEVLATRVETLLEDSEAIVRQVALASVRLMRKPENLARVQSAVLARMADPAAPVRTAAIWAAAHLPTDAAREQVRAQLKSKEEPMRFSAACALADKQDSGALEVLAAALEQDHQRQEALSALMALGDAAAVEPIAAIFEGERLGAFDRTLAAAALARFGDERGAQHLISRIEESADDRPVAAEWAGRLGVKSAAPALFALADEEGDPARGSALRALGRLHADGAWEKLRGFASDAKAAEDLRMDAAEGLAELGTPEARALLEMLAKEGGELGPLCEELLAELAMNDARASETKEAAS